MVIEKNKILILSIFAKNRCIIFGIIIYNVCICKNIQQSTTFNYNFLYYDSQFYPPLYQIGGKRVSFCVAFLMLLALFLIPVKTFARYEIIDEMRYNIIDDYAVLASNTDWKYTGNIVVPQKVTASDGKKYPVTALEEGCFRDCKTVTSVLLPSSITKIGEYCFCGCIHLQSVNIPSSATSLGKSTFSGCSSLTSIEIPSNVNYLGKSCFDNCSSLTSINIPSSITSLSGGCFCFCI